MNQQIFLKISSFLFLLLFLRLRHHFVHFAKIAIPLKHAFIFSKIFYVARLNIGGVPFGC